MVEVKAASLATSPLVQAYFSSARSVKALHNLDYIRLVTSAYPRNAPHRRALPIAGDDAAAKEAVGRFLDDIGYDAVDVGGPPRRAGAAGLLCPSIAKPMSASLWRNVSEFYPPHFANEISC